MWRVIFGLNLERVYLSGTSGYRGSFFAKGHAEGFERKKEQTLTFYHCAKCLGNLSHDFVTKFSNAMNKPGGVDSAHLQNIDSR